MTDTEGSGPAPKTTDQAVDPSKTRAPSGRRRGGRGRRPRPAKSEGEQQGEAASAATTEGSGGVPTTERSASASKAGGSTPRRPTRGRGGHRSGSADLKAIQRQVQGIVDTLQRSLEEMEAAQRLLEQINTEREEDQKTLAELRQTLDQFQSRRGDPRSRSSPHRGA